MPKFLQSIHALWACYGLIFTISFFYYPKWQQDRSEASIGWDVSGYYWYLPAFFIYDDPYQLSFANDVREKYHPPLQIISSRSRIGVVVRS